MLEEEEEIRESVENKLSLPGGPKEQLSQAGNLKSQPLQFKIPSNASKDEDKEPSDPIPGAKKLGASLPKGPKKKLTQIPQRKVSDDEGSFDFDDKN